MQLRANNGRSEEKLNLWVHESAPRRLEIDRKTMRNGLGMVRVSDHERLVVPLRGPLEDLCLWEDRLQTRRAHGRGDPEPEPMPHVLPLDDFGLCGDVSRLSCAPSAGLSTALASKGRSSRRRGLRALKAHVESRGGDPRQACARRAVGSSDELKRIVSSLRPQDYEAGLRNISL